MTQPSTRSTARLGRAVRSAWGRTARFRAGASAAVRVGAVTAGAVRAIATAPLPPAPDTSRSTPASQSRVLTDVERQGARRLGDFARRDLGARGEQVSRATARPATPPDASERRPPEVGRAAARRTEQALGRSAPSAPTRGRSAGRPPGRGR